jgi:hypothetical protein
MANWIKTHKGDYVNLETANSISIIEYLNTNTFSVLVNYGEYESTEIYKGTEEKCRQFAKELCELKFVGQGPNGVLTPIYKANLVDCM